LLDIPVLLLIVYDKTAGASDSKKLSSSENPDTPVTFPVQDGETHLSGTRLRPSDGQH
jgi:hypothetical protein